MKACPTSKPMQVDTADLKAELQLVIEQLRATNGKISINDLQDFSPEIITAAMTLNSYPRGARDPAFKGKYSKVVEKIEGGIAQRSVQDTLNLVSELRNRIFTENPQVLAILQPVSHD